MEVERLELAFEDVTITPGEIDIRVSGGFVPGIHLVSGVVGSGKSTLAMAAAGLLEPGKGRIVRSGIQTSMLSFQFPEQALTGNTIAEEVASYGLDIPGTLARAGLPGRELDDPLSLSRGELKRLNLSCVLSAPPDLLVLDEPFAALDCVGKREVCRWIEDRRSSIVILCTHEQHILPRVDAIWEFQGHTLVWRGPVPAALPGWDLAPPLVRALISAGAVPRNVSEEDLQEAACRIQG